MQTVNSLCNAVVFKSQYRCHKQFENDAPLSALWRGRWSRLLGERPRLDKANDAEATLA